MHKTATYKNGWSVYMGEPNGMAGLRLVTLRDANGDIRDKMRCDTYRGALEYYAAFKRVAKNA